MSANPDERLAYVGRCIYCGSDKNLTDEHILAAGLNGNYVLEAASCDLCASITSGIETKFLSATRIARAALGMGAKRRKTKPRTAPVWVTVDGIRRQEYLPLEESTLSVGLPIFPRAGWFGGRVQSEALRMSQSPAVIMFGRSAEGVMNRLAPVR